MKDNNRYWCRQQKAARRNELRSCSCYCSPRPTSNLCGPNLSPPQRCLCVVGMAGEKKKKTRGERWEWEARPLPYNVRFCGFLWFWLNEATVWTILIEGHWEDNSINEG